MKKYFAKSFGLALIWVLIANMNLTVFAGDPIPGIDVRLKSSTGKEYIAKTGSDGNFTISKLPKGTYSISVRCVDGTCAKVTAPRDAASGQATGKRSSTSSDNKVSLNYQKIEWDYTVKSPRETGSGMATGRRLHKPVTITKDWCDSQSFTIEEDGSSYTGHITLMK